MTFEFGDVLKSSINDIGDVRLMYICPISDPRAWADMNVIVLKDSAFIGWAGVMVGEQLELYAKHWVKDEKWPSKD